MGDVSWRVGVLSTIGWHLGCLTNPKDVVLV